MAFHLQNKEAYTITRLQQAAIQPPNLRAMYIDNLSVGQMKKQEIEILQMNVMALVEQEYQSLKKTILPMIAARKEYLKEKQGKQSESKRKQQEKQQERRRERQETKLQKKKKLFRNLIALVGFTLAFIAFVKPKSFVVSKDQSIVKSEPGGFEIASLAGGVLIGLIVAVGNCYYGLKKQE